MVPDPVSEFEGHRSRLFGLAYRLLGSAEDAEDVVQDAFLRWHAAQRAAIVAPSAWLAKIVTNLCLNRLTSARARQYVGPWLPEPVLSAHGALGPLELAEQRESVSLALLVLMEQLTPRERAVFVLREAFGYSHREVAELLGTGEANSRQLHRRARQRIAQGSAADGIAERGRPDPGRTRWQSLVERFLLAAQSGDLHGLEQLLAADVAAWADGGGAVTAARRPVLGRDRVARYLAGTLTKFGAGMQVTQAEVNGEIALLGWSGTALLGVLVPEIRDGEITAVRIVANPDKLRFAARQAGRLSHPTAPSGS